MCEQNIVGERLPAVRAGYDVLKRRIIPWWFRRSRWDTEDGFNCAVAMRAAPALQSPQNRLEDRPNSLVAFIALLGDFDFAGAEVEGQFNHSHFHI